MTLDVVGDINRWEPDSWKGYVAGLLERARQPDLEGRVRFLGAREDVPALLAAASVHCFPSRIETREGFGIVAVEAKAAGVPSVVTPSGALPELVAHRDDGWVCRDDSVEALVEGLEYFLSNPDALAAAGVRAHASAGQHSREFFVAECLDVFGVASPHHQLAPADVVHRHAD